MKTADGTIQSVVRAVSILEAAASNPRTLTAQVAADSAGVPLPTAYHLLKTLVQAGYLAKEGRTYSLSSKVLELAGTLERDLYPGKSVWAAIDEVAARTGETTYASRWYQGDATIAAVVDGKNAVRVASLYPGLRGHAYARASGKVLLAFGPPHRCDDYLERTRLEPRTRNTIVDPLILRRVIETTREQGYAVDREEYLTGVCCLAAPIFEAGGWPTMAITVTIPASRFDAVFEGAKQALLDATRRELAAN
jgi:IclR family transcriptional regulator, acetate operon repressor